MTQNRPAPPRSLLVATDFSEDARHAALRAGTLARELGIAKIALLHVAPPHPLAGELEAQAARAMHAALARLAAELEAESGVPFEPRLAAGAMVDEIARSAAQFDLTVLGARGQSPLRDLVLGTSAERLLRKTTRPMLVVRRRPEAAYREVVVPVDFSADSAAAFMLAGQLAPAATLHLVHAYDVPFEGKLRLAGVADHEIERYRRAAREQAGRDMDAMAGAAGIPLRRTSRVIARDYAPRLIADTARETGAELVAVGKHGRSMLEEFFLGSVTLHVLADPGHDVLVVPGTRG